VEGGRIVDGIGGSSGPLGFRAAGALDGEVAFLAGKVSKSMIFTGGFESISGDADLAGGPPMPVARAAYLEAAVKAVASLRVSSPDATEVILSGRVMRSADVREDVSRRLRSISDVSAVEVLRGFSASAMQAAHGAALLADGLAGGSEAVLVEHLGIREARGTVLDHLYVISREQAKRTLGIK
jgi:predicted butyrate kinase (DUF1464 family)